MAADTVDFDTWISEKFVALGTDETVFGPYVKSIVEGDETLEEKIDALDGIISELGDGNLDVEAFRQEILAKWDQHQKACSDIKCVGGGGAETNLESKLESILKMNDDLRDTQPSNSQDDKGPKGLSQTPDSALRAAILNQYKDDSDGDEDAESQSPSCSGGGGGGFSGLERNTNVERVQGEIKDRREREKAESAKKREKDREDRAKQKQQAQERKDKAKKKSAKVERKR